MNQQKNNDGIYKSSIFKIYYYLYYYYTLFNYLLIYFVLFEEIQNIFLLLLVKLVNLKRKRKVNEGLQIEHTSYGTGYTEYFLIKQETSE